MHTSGSSWSWCDHVMGLIFCPYSFLHRKYFIKALSLMGKTRPLQEQQADQRPGTQADSWLEQCQNQNATEHPLLLLVACAHV